MVTHCIQLGSSQTNQAKSATPEGRASDFFALPNKSTYVFKSVEATFPSGDVYMKLSDAETLHLHSGSIITRENHLRGCGTSLVVRRVNVMMEISFF